MEYNLFTSIPALLDSTQPGKSKGDKAASTIMSPNKGYRPLGAEEQWLNGEVCVPMWHQLLCSALSNSHLLTPLCLYRTSTWVICWTISLQLRSHHPLLRLTQSLPLHLSLPHPQAPFQLPPSQVDWSMRAPEILSSLAEWTWVNFRSFSSILLAIIILYPLPYIHFGLLFTQVDSALQCMLNENSLEYVSKFADLATQIGAQADPTNPQNPHMTSSGNRPALKWCRLSSPCGNKTEISWIWSNSLNCCKLPEKCFWQKEEWKFRSKLSQLVWHSLCHSVFLFKLCWMILRCGYISGC